MARIARVVLPGLPHLVTQRGVRKRRVFRSDKERRLYLALLAEQAERYGVSFRAYCLMTDHVHLVLVPARKNSLARALAQAHRLYTRAANLRAGERGHLFQGRFHSCPLDERRLMAAMRYVERNPVRAGLAGKAWAYPWSSAAFHVGRRQTDPLVTQEHRMVSPVDWRDRLSADPDEMEFLRRSAGTGRPCGSPKFIKKIEAITHRILHPLPPGRPPKKKRRPR